jgi:carboxyl-terminal processing protease
MPLRNLIVLFTAAILSLICYHTAIRNHYGGLVASAIGEISRNFVEPVDSRQLFVGAMKGMVEQLDPYSGYIGPEELSEFQETMDQQFGGIGIVVEVNPETDRLTVLSPLPDTPAYESGLRAGDVILAIDGQSTEGFQLSDAVALMRGQPGTRVRLEVLHLGDENPLEVEVARAIIPVASVLGDRRGPDGSWTFVMPEHPNLAYIRLISFAEQTSEELAETLGTLQDRVAGLILDLRGNAGGLLTTAVETADLFLNEGTIVSIRGRDPRQWVDYEATTRSTVCPDLPLVVLVDRYSASASEIVAACLQDQGRAIVVGQRTWGKGTVQNVIPFEGGRSALKLTTASYWRPSGQNIHRGPSASDDDAWGVRPSSGWKVELTDEQMRQVVQYRRQRDFGPFPHDENEQDDEDASREQIPPADPQLEKAIQAARELIMERRRLSTAA